MKTGATSNREKRLVAADEWLRVNESEFLCEFIPGGGSAVRFVSGETDDLQSVIDSLESTAREKELYYIHFDPSCLTEDGKKPDFHHIERFFFHLSRSIDWKTLAGEQIVSALQSQGIRFPDNRATTDYKKVAQDSGLDPDDLMNKYQRLITDLVLKDLDMALEFRIALTALGRALLIPEEITPTTEELLIGWLRGERAIPGTASTLKRIRIFERIGRSNARHMLQSLLHWLPKSGRGGLVATFDFRPYELARKSQKDRIEEAKARGASDEEIGAIVRGEGSETQAQYYGPSAYISMLELLRHFIDEVESLKSALLVVLGTRRFFDDKPKVSLKERRYYDYNALQTRIGMEIHDVERQNPSGPLVHIGGH